MLFADLLSLHLITFLMFFSLVVRTNNYHGTCVYCLQVFQVSQGAKAEGLLSELTVEVIDSQSDSKVEGNDDPQDSKDRQIKKGSSMQ